MLFKMSKSEFDKVLDVMVEAFPYDERRTKEAEFALLSNPDFHIYVYKEDECGEIKGFISLYDLDEFCFLEHFAISSEYRNQGIGSKILAEIKALYVNIVFEVEPPITEQAVKRICFYERNGFVLNDYEYIQPPMCEGRAQVPLMIMSSAPLDSLAFERIKKTLYKNVYHVC